MYFEKLTDKKQIKAFWTIRLNVKYNVDIPTTLREAIKPRELASPSSSFYKASAILSLLLSLFEIATETQPYDRRCEKSWLSDSRK